MSTYYFYVVEMEGEDGDKRRITFLIKKKSLYSVQEFLSGDFYCNGFIFCYLCTLVIRVFSLLFSYCQKVYENQKVQQPFHWFLYLEAPWGGGGIFGLNVIYMLGSNFSFIEKLFKTWVYLSMSKISKNLFLWKYILRVIGKIMNKKSFEKLNKHNGNATQDENSWKQLIGIFILIPLLR